MVLNHFTWGYIENTVDRKNPAPRWGYDFCLTEMKIYFRTPRVVQDFFPINNMIIWCLMTIFNPVTWGDHSKRKICFLIAIRRLLSCERVEDSFPKG